MGACVSKQSESKKGESSMFDGYMGSNECYKKRLNNDIQNNLRDSTQSIPETLLYGCLPDNQDSYKPVILTLPAVESSSSGDTGHTSADGYSKAIVESSRHEYDKPLTSCPPPYAPWLPPREPPQNPLWSAALGRGAPAGDLYRVSEKQSGLNPFYVNSSVEWEEDNSENEYHLPATFIAQKIPATIYPTDKNSDIADFLIQCKRVKANKNGVLHISNITNDVFAPENSDVKVIFPKMCSSFADYRAKCQIHTDFKQFTNHVQWTEDEWFIGPVPELNLVDVTSESQRRGFFSTHVCVMVPHCVEPDLLPYIRVHYSQPEQNKYGKVVRQLYKPETYVPKPKIDPDECFIVTENYVLIYTRHFTQFICTCTKKSRLRVEGFLFGSHGHVTGEQEVNLRLYLCKPIYKIKDFAQELMNREKKLKVARQLIERFNLMLPFNDIQSQDRLVVTLTSAEGVSLWKPPEALSSGQFGDHHLRQSVLMDELQPCDWCAESQSPWSPTEVSRLLIHRYGNRKKLLFRGVSTVDVMKKDESHPVTSTNIHFSIDMTGNNPQVPSTEIKADHLGYAFQEIAFNLKQEMIFPLARQLGIRDPQMEAIAFRFPGDLVEQKMQLLTAWRNKEGKSADVEQLINHLLKLRPPQRNLAEELYKFIFGKELTRITDRPLPPLPAASVPDQFCNRPRLPVPGYQDYQALSTLSYVRTQYGIPESESGVEEAAAVAETHPKMRAVAPNPSTTTDLTPEDEAFCEALSAAIVEPVYMLPEEVHAQRQVQGQSETVNQSLPMGGYPNLQLSFRTPIQAQSSLIYQSGDAGDGSRSEDYPETSDYEYYVEIVGGRRIEVERPIVVPEVPDRPPNLDEIVELRDLQEDGEASDEDYDNVPELNENQLGAVSEYTECVIITDLVLKELKNNCSTEKCYIRVQNDLEFQIAANLAKSLPQFPNLKSVVLHCGFRHSKKEMTKSLKKAIKNCVDQLDEIYPDADLYFSAVLPCRGNKNSFKIAELNKAIEEICAESSAEFVDFRSELIDPASGKPKNSFFSDTVSLNFKGAKKVHKALQKITGVGEDDCRDMMSRLGIQTRGENQKPTLGTDAFEDKNTEKPSLKESSENIFGFKLPNQLDFNFSGL